MEINLEISRLKFQPEKTRKHYYKYTLLNVSNSNSTIIYRVYQVIIHKTIIHNRPDIIIKEKVDKITYLTNIAIPLANNIKKIHSKEKMEKKIEPILVKNNENPNHIFHPSPSTFVLSIP